jgi:hypothetical protein
MQFGLGNPATVTVSEDSAAAGAEGCVGISSTFAKLQRKAQPDVYVIRPSTPQDGRAKDLDAWISPRKTTKIVPAGYTHVIIVEQTV